jgi:hypothetical protein
MIRDNEEYDEEEVDRDTKSVVISVLSLALLIAAGCIALIYWLW